MHVRGGGLRAREWGGAGIESPSALSRLVLSRGGIGFFARRRRWIRFGIKNNQRGKKKKRKAQTSALFLHKRQTEDDSETLFHWDSTDGAEGVGMRIREETAGCGGDVLV